MRIKKFHKIICLGMALLSIMVLPCYADFDIVLNDNISIIGSGYYEIFPNINNLQINGYDYLSGLYVYKNENENNNFGIISYNRENLILVYYLADNEFDENNLPTLLKGRIKPYSYDLVNFNFGETNLELYELRYKVTPYYFYEYSNEEFNYYSLDLVLYNELFGAYIPRESERFYLYIFDEVSNAVFNITTYTNLLTQNFAKAFTFMTGPALPWVLLGISISLISFGVYSAKRFI